MVTRHIDLTQRDGVPTKRSGKQTIKSILQRTGALFMDQWATMVMALLGLLVLTALAVPLLSFFGFDGLSKQFFFTLHYVCAQIPSHSFYILGHQLGLCARNLSIYASMFLFSLIFVLSKKRVPGIPWYVWILLMLPMAWDGGTQLFGLRESTWYLRLLTGTLFGFGSAWFALPMMHKTLLETIPPTVRKNRVP